MIKLDNTEIKKNMINTESEVNNILTKALQSYFLLKKEGKDQLANIILAAGSRIADNYLSALRLRENYGKVYCRNCRQQLRLGFEIQFYNQYGFCLQCDKLLAEHDCHNDRDDGCECNDLFN